MAEVEINVTENGPYVVKGEVRLTDADGNVYDLSGRLPVALCRCGGSTTKPFCDGTTPRPALQPPSERSPKRASPGRLWDTDPLSGRGAAW
jgi:3-phenylpropionate/trans-cinnamate dioxygenase ferredoxin subunit